MKVSCSKTKLKENLFFAERNSGKSFNMPILQGVRLRTGNGRLNIAATNLEAGFEAEMSAKIFKEGEVVVPVRIFSQLISGLGGETVALESVGNNLNISTERVSSLIKGYLPEEFPLIPKFKPENSFDITRDELISGLRAVVNSASVSNMKPEIASIYFYFQNRAPLKIVATDSFRLAEKTLNCPVKNSSPFLLPAPSAAELIRMAEVADGDIRVAYDKNQISFTAAEFKFTSRLTEGVFPAYESIIPKKFNTDVLVDREEMIEALRVASVFSGNLKEVNLNVLSDDNILEIRTAHSDVGEHTAQLNVKITGEKVSLNFNYHYLLDGLLNYQNKGKILLRFAEGNKPLLLQNPENTAYLYLVMPMKSV